MSREQRVALLRAIEEKRGSKVIAYFTTDRPGLHAQIASDAVSILHEHILSIPPAQRAKLDLVLYSRGGDSDVPWSVVSMFREYCREGSFSVLVPYKAHSAGTVICLGADEIVMTKKAELGPIDITISSGPYNPTDSQSAQRLPVTVEDVTGYFSLLEKVGCSRPEEKMRGFEQLTQHVHPLVLGTVSRLLQQTQLVALRLLGTRAKPFSEERNRDIVRRLSSEIFSHRHTISRTEALSYLNLEQVVQAEVAGIDDELWELYGAYRALFELETAFAPEEHLVAHGLEEHVWNELQLASVESVARWDSFQQDVRVRTLRQAPPQVQLNLSNVALPQINFPVLPAGMQPEHVSALIQQLLPAILQPVIERVAHEAADSFRAALPIVGYERSAFNSGWKVRT